MDVKNLNTFIHVAELASFSRAGEMLGYSQPTISVQIRQLEQELGVRLFDRIGHAVRLTDKGRQMLVYAQEVCHVCHQMRHNAGEETPVPTVIRLAMADSLCAPLMERIFSGLREKCGHISLQIRTAGTTELFSMLDHNEVDLVCTLDSHIYNTGYVIAGEEEIGVHFVLSSRHPLAEKDVLEIDDILLMDFLLTERGMSYRRQLDEWLARESLEISPVLETGSADLICRLVEQGMGASFLPDYVTEEAVRKGSAVRMNVRGFEPELWKQLIYHRDKWVSDPMQSVIDHLKSVRLDVNQAMHDLL